VAGEPDQRAPNRDTGNEGARAVDRIEHPDIFGIDVLVAELLPQHAMGREAAFDQMAHHALAGAVALGHRIEHATGRLVLQRVMRTEERQDRLAGLRREIRDEGTEIDSAHQVLFSCRVRLPPATLIIATHAEIPPWRQGEHNFPGSLCV